MYLTRREDGSYWPSYPRDAEASAKIKPGKEVKVSQARNPDFHRKVMAVVNMLFENQEKYDNITLFRKILGMKAGYVDWVEGTDGKMHPIPQSWSFDSMNQETFEELYAAVKEVAAKELGINVDEVEKNAKNYM